MKVLFVSNYMTQHQLPFANEMYRILGDDFLYLETNEFENERKNMGWQSDFSDLPYLRKYRHIEDDSTVLASDVVICGGTHFIYIKKRLDAGKLTFRYMERLYKNGRIHAFTPKGYLKKFSEHTKYNGQQAYLLCAGAYVPADFDLFFGYKNKRLKWGYFPETNNKEWAEIRSKKESDTIRILWTGRMLGWKHCMDALMVAKRLMDKKISFSMQLIGNGEDRAKAEDYINKYNLAEYVTISDFVPANEVRNYMEGAHIYLMTSDFNEGWGAVVNEAMDSGCAVVASSGAGAVPYLIKDGINGFVYKNGDVDELSGIVERLCNDRESILSAGEKAHATIEKTWNANYAAERFCEFCKKVIESNDKNASHMFNDGPMSYADSIAPAKGYKYTKG